MAKKLTVKQISEKIGRLKAERQTWMTHWQQLTDYLMPRKNTVTNEKSPGQKRAVSLLDNTGVMSNELLAGALHGLLTNPDQEWFEMTTGDIELDRKDNVRMWLQKIVTQMHQVLNNSNFQTEVHELYCDLCCIGTGIMYIEEDPISTVRFSTKFIAECMIDENYRGFVDQLFREWKWDAHKIIQEFGITKVNQKIRDSYAKGGGEKFMVHHAVYPRDLVDPNHKSEFGYVCQYTLPDFDFELREEGFREFPYVAPRWTKGTGETYGRSPGMTALPEVRTINVMTETTLIGLQKAVDPPIQMPDDGYILPIKTKPGGINYYRSGTNENNKISAVFNDTRVDFGFQALEDRRKRIREAYYTDQLKLQQGPQMTATEVLQRTEEAMRLLGPMLGRQQVEFLRPLIDRVFAIMLRTNKINIQEIPPELKGRKLDVKYSSLIAKSQRMAMGQNILRGFEALQPFVQLDQSVAQNIDGDKAYRVITETYGWPQEITRTAKDLATIRKAQQDAQQAAMNDQRQAAQVAAAPKMVEAMNGLGAQVGPK